MTCSACDDTGFVISEGRHGELAVACDCRRRKIRVRRFTRRRQDDDAIPPRYRDVTTSDPAIKALRPQALRRINAYRREVLRRIAEGKGLWLFGPDPFDKNRAAALVALSAQRAGLLVAFTTATRLLTEFKDPRPLDHPDRPDPATTVMAPDLLVLRELDSIPSDDWTLPRLASELRRRAEQDASAVIVTSDAHPSDLGPLWGWSTISSLKQVCGPSVALDPEYEPPDIDPYAIKISRRRQREERAARIRNSAPHPAG